MNGIQGEKKGKELRMVPKFCSEQRQAPRTHFPHRVMDVEGWFGIQVYAATVGGTGWTPGSVRQVGGYLCVKVRYKIQAGQGISSRQVVLKAMGNPGMETAQVEERCES